jgi:colicin import membrane protein
MKPAAATAGARRLRPHWHAPERGTGPAFAISLLAHALLFLSIAFVVRWKTVPSGPVGVELWGGLPAIVEPTPPPPPPPPPRVERAPEPEPQKADIVLEQKKAAPRPEPPKKVEPPQKVEPPKKAEPAKKAAPDPEQVRREAEAKAAEAAAARRQQAAVERALAAAGGTVSGPAGGGPVAGGGGIARGYESQVVGCIRPHIAFSVPDGLQPRQHVAEFEVQLLPSGEQVGSPRLLRASGLAAYDSAVERAIRRCDPFPRPREGVMPRSLRLSFDPVDTK